MPRSLVQEAKRDMPDERVEQVYKELTDTILERNPGVDLGRVRAAFELADRATAVRPGGRVHPM